MSSSELISRGGVRFAPSPTGSFHIGNLRTAWISREWARIMGLPWVVRFEDIDAPRVLKGAKERQLADMASLGCVPSYIYDQSSRRSRHWGLFLEAHAAGVVYPCFCSRKEVRDAVEASASAPHGELPLYSGRCRRAIRGSIEDPGLPSVAWRFASEAAPEGTRDFVVARTRTSDPDEASFAPSYPWACAIDDFDGRYDLLVRAWDLAPVADQQREIQGWISNALEEAAASPAIFHTALVVRDDGQRLEKRTAGVTLSEILERGISQEGIVERFKESFQPGEGKFPEGYRGGEMRREIPLAVLGF